MFWRTLLPPSSLQPEGHDLNFDGHEYLMLCVFLYCLYMNLTGTNKNENEI
jgi:hypothetical protein